MQLAEFRCIRVSVASTGEVQALAVGNSTVQAICNGMSASASLGVVPSSGSQQTQPSNVQYQWEAPVPGSTDSLGSLTIVASNGTPTEVLRPAVRSVFGTMRCVSAAWDKANQMLTIAYEVGGLPLHIALTPVERQGQLTVSMSADAPLISSLDAGTWNALLEAQPLVVPYYDGKVSYMAATGDFANAWWDWHSTGSTILSATDAQYSPRTDGSLALMHEQLNVVMSPNVDEVLPSPGNQASPYMSQMAGRMVIDIWTAGFSAVQQGIEELGDYGLKNCAAIIHDWQHAGYDNALPEHYTANPNLGGDPALSSAVAAGKSSGCLMAVHENYVDYYPNYPQFDAAAVSLTSDGDWLASWKNGLGIQSYSAKPSWILKNAAMESPIIHQRYGTTADYLDVSSAAPISSHGDLDARQPNAGSLTAWMQANASLWAYERQTHGGPVLGEGLNHWYYSGQLDGVEAQLGDGYPLGTDVNLPLFVDFDLLRMHPLQVNHGMGYYGRWVHSGSSITSTEQMDAYRMQEIAYGHAPFVDTTNWNDVTHAFVEGGLVTPVAASYGTAHVSAIQYAMDGSWVSPSQAARNGTFATVEVTYNNGLSIAANASSTPVLWNGFAVPQYGWVAKGNQLLAYTAMCGGNICDYAETPTSLFANARNQSDLRIGVAPAAPSAISVQPKAYRQLSILYNWKVFQKVASNYEVFVHFVNDDDLQTDAGIVFQDDHETASPTSSWVPNTLLTDGPWTVPVPSSVPDGKDSIRMGLYDPNTGNRVHLAGIDDGTERYIVGYLIISQGGNVMNLEPPPVEEDDPRLNAAGSVVNFGSIQTDGMVSVDQENGQWVLRSFPRNRAVTVLLDSSRFPVPVTVQAVGGNVQQVMPISQGQYWQLPMVNAKTYAWPIPSD